MIPLKGSASSNFKASQIDSFSDFSKLYEDLHMPNNSSSFGLFRYSSTNSLDGRASEIPVNSEEALGLSLSPEKISKLNAKFRTTLTGSPERIKSIPSLPCMIAVQEMATIRKKEELEKERESAVYNLNEKKIRLAPLEVDGKKVEGGNSSIYTLSSIDSDQIYETIENANLIVKMGKESKSMEIYKAGLKQYDDLIARKDRSFGVEPILNRDTCTSDGFLVQRKITPFKEAPWTASERLEDMDKKKLDLLDQITNCFIFSLLDREKAALDLRWENFHQEDGKLVLFDFYELDDPFSLIAPSSLKEVSNGNPEVAEYILEKLKPHLQNEDQDIASLNQMNGLIEKMKENLLNPSKKRKIQEIKLNPNIGFLCT